MIINGGVYFKCRDSYKWRITRQSIFRGCASVILKDDLCHVRLASSHHPQVVIESPEAITLYLHGSSFKQDNQCITDSQSGCFVKVFRAMALCKKNNGFFKNNVIL